MSKPSDYQFIHSTYVKLERDDVVIINEKNVDTNESRLKVIERPKRRFYVSKKNCRQHECKLEYSPMHNLDMYVCDNMDMEYNISRALGYRNKIYRKILFNSPYLWGADIDIQTLIKIDYRKRVTRYPSLYKIGALDIETSVLGNNEIIAITYTNHDNTCYTAAYEPFMQGQTIDELRAIVDPAMVEFADKINKNNPKLKIDVPKVHLYTSNKELDLIKWIFDRIHECKPDFIGIWNLGFDIPYILTRLAFLQTDAASIMAHPEVPPKYRYVKFKPDSNPKLQHFTDKWDWVDITGYSQFYDAQCLYSRLRKVKGREVSYSLDYVADKILGVGKLELGPGGLHQVMQSTKFLEYVAYNIVDTLLVKLMDNATGDVDNMVGIIGPSNLNILAKQTSQLRDNFYEYCMDRKCVSATVGGDLTTDYDSIIRNVGGAVLDPLRTKNTGAHILKELDIETSLVKFACDIDAASLYPSLDVTFNIAKETKKFTCLRLVGRDLSTVNAFFSMAVSPESNAVYLANIYFGLANYQQIDQLIK